MNLLLVCTENKFRGQNGQGFSLDVPAGFLLEFLNARGRPDCWRCGFFVAGYSLFIEP